MYFSKTFFLLAATVAIFSGCASSSLEEYRLPAGTGSIDSSTSQEVDFQSYKLPITRNGVTAKQVAQNFWGGEWPGPVVDVNSSKAGGSTTIQAYTNLRNPKPEDRVSCTIKNGVYNPWAKDNQDPSAIVYYTISGITDYDVIQSTVIWEGIGPKIKAVKGSVIENVVYYGENFCGAILKIGKNRKPVTGNCDAFANKKFFIPKSTNTNFPREQWLYLECAETKDGTPIHAFVQDDDILKQSGIQRGCFPEYGSIAGGTNCKNER